MNNIRTIIILNGDVVPNAIFRKFYKKGDYIICADGGANTAKKYRILPNIILGDLDSITNSNLSFYRKKGVEIRKITEQETTDFEKALMYVVAFNLENVIVFGAISGRPDHTMNNFSVMKRYSKVLDIKIIDRKFEVFYLKKKLERDYAKNKVVSFLGFPAAYGVTTKGLKYKLNNETLEFGVREGTLNVSSSKKIIIEKKRGNLLVFLSHI